MIYMNNTSRLLARLNFNLFYNLTTTGDLTRKLSLVKMNGIIL